MPEQYYKLGPTGPAIGFGSRLRLGLIGEAPEEIRIDGTITVVHELDGERLERIHHGTGTVRPTEGGGCEATWEMWPRR